ncbi:hypothetical protein ABZY57_25745 [Streptomyces sp. NPDC006450]|uniref:hypothetical protein n=1 Tax=Streptomyces sp. NPDC006450 TaxID=3155458 RepID=UPI0033B3C5B2
MLRLHAHVLVREQHAGQAVTLIKHTASQLAGGYDQQPHHHLSVLAPGVPVLPVSASAPRHPLERTPDGDWTLTDPAAGQVRRFAPPAGDPDGDGIAPIAQLEDRNGNLITFEFDAHGTPLGMAHSGGYRLRFDTADGRITALHLDGGPRILAYGYTAGDLTEVVNSSGLPLRFTYDDRGRITSWIDTNNRSYAYTYDEQNRCVAEGGGEGHMVLRLAYDALDEATGHRVTETVTGEGHTRRYLPVDKLDRFNELTQNRSWVKIFGGPN